MRKKKKLELEIIDLKYRVKELEEKLCPLNSHDYILVKTDFDSGIFNCIDIDPLYVYKCRNCGKEYKTYIKYSI